MRRFIVAVAIVLAFAGQMGSANASGLDYAVRLTSNDGCIVGEVWHDGGLLWQLAIVTDGAWPATTAQRYKVVVIPSFNGGFLGLTINN